MLRCNLKTRAIPAFIWKDQVGMERQEMLGHPVLPKLLFWRSLEET
jgi:hypothetical protein